MRLIAYIRVSTSGQVTDGLGLPTQERLIRQWTKESGHRLLRVVSDNGKSGLVPLDQRPGLLEALTAVKRHEADGIVVTSLDRVARVLHVQEAVLASVWKAGGRVFSVDTGEILEDDPDDPMRTFVRQVMGAVAQLDRASVVKRLRNGRITKAAQGGRPVGRAPYGWVADDGGLKENDTEQAVIARIRDWSKSGVSLAEIARRLNADGVPTKSKQSGAKWHPLTVARVICRQG